MGLKLTDCLQGLGFLLVGGIIRPGRPLDLLLWNFNYFLSRSFIRQLHHLGSYFIIARLAHVGGLLLSYYAIYNPINSAERA